MSKIIAMVSMKGHSSRVPNKNIRDLAGRPLFYWIIKSLTETPEIDEVIVETDSDNIENKVKSFFNNITLLSRPKELVGDDTPMNDLIAFNMQNCPADIYIQTHSTNPMLKSETISDAIKAFKKANKENNTDSLFSVTPLQTRLFWKDGAAVNHNPNELLPTQDLPPVFEENSNIFIFTKESFAKRHHRIGTNPIMFPMDALEAVDIDEEPDFEFADYLMRKRLESTKTK